MAKKRKKENVTNSILHSENVTLVDILPISGAKSNFTTLSYLIKRCGNTLFLSDLHTQAQSTSLFPHAVRAPP